MGIGPIPDFRDLPRVEPRTPDLEVSVVARIENSARPGGNSPGRRQAAGREDAELAENKAEPEAEETAPAAEDKPGNQVDFFA